MTKIEGLNRFAFGKSLSCTLKIKFSLKEEECIPILLESLEKQGKLRGVSIIFPEPSAP